MASLQDLPEEIIFQIFNRLTFSTRRSILPLVCKDWQQLTLRSPALWESVQIDGAEEGDTWRLLERAAGRETVSPPTLAGRTKAISEEKVRNWFEWHLPAVISLRAWGVGCEWRQSCLVLPISALWASLRELDLEHTWWVGDQLCFNHLSCLVNLKKLRLGAWYIPMDEPNCFKTTDLEGLSGLSLLEELAIHIGSQDGISASLDAFPASFFTLTRLKRLSLTGFSFDLFPKQLSAFSLLESLEICLAEVQADQLEEMMFPSSLVSLSRCESSLTAFASDQQLRQLVGLRELDLYLNKLSELPDMRALRNLERLDCHGNCFTDLPVQQLSALTAMTRLDFENQGFYYLTS